MNKFGLIDVFTKLAQDKNTVSNISSVVNSLFNNSKLKQNAKTNKTTDNSPNPYSQNAIVSLLKRHEELSKQIDLNEKKKPPLSRVPERDSATK